MAIVDHRREYLQIRVHESLRPYQTVIFRCQRYCLTKFGFGLNVAPSVKKSELTVVLTKDGTVDRATSSYLDDIFVNVDVVSARCVENHLLRMDLNVSQRNVWLTELECWVLKFGGGARRATLEAQQRIR